VCFPSGKSNPSWDDGQRKKPRANGASIRFLVSLAKNKLNDLLLRDPSSDDARYQRNAHKRDGSSACFKTNAIWASVNFDAFMEISSSPQGDHKWKIPVLNGLI
jgi:hypothetical protein